MSINTICAGIGALALIGCLAACGAAGSPAAAPTARVTQTVTAVPTPTVTKTVVGVPTPTVTKTVGTPVHVAPAAPVLTACGLGTYNEEVYAGPDTSCPFALNVEELWSSAPSNTFSAYSPVTGLSYTMTCNGADTTDCTGGNNAFVRFTL